MTGRHIRLIIEAVQKQRPVVDGVQIYHEHSHNWHPDKATSAGVYRVQVNYRLRKGGVEYVHRFESGNFWTLLADIRAWER